MALTRTTLNRLVWGVRIFLALAFGAAGVSKLLGVQQMVDIFTHIGIGQWFRYVTGAVEVTGALLLLVPSTGFYGALLLGATMACAVATHLLVIGGSPIPAIVLGLLSGFVAYRLKPSGAGSPISASARV